MTAPVNIIRAATTNTNSPRFSRAFCIIKILLPPSQGALSGAQTAAVAIAADLEARFYAGQQSIMQVPLKRYYLLPLPPLVDCEPCLPHARGLPMYDHTKSQCDYRDRQEVNAQVL